MSRQSLTLTSSEVVHLGGVYRLETPDGFGVRFKVLMRSGHLWRVVWLNGSGQQGDLATVVITACSRLLRRGSPVRAYNP